MILVIWPHSSAGHYAFQIMENTHFDMQNMCPKMLQKSNLKGYKIQEGKNVQHPVEWPLNILKQFWS